MQVLGHSQLGLAAVHIGFKLFPSGGTVLGLVQKEHSIIIKGNCQVN